MVTGERVPDLSTYEEAPLTPFLALIGLLPALALIWWLRMSFRGPVEPYGLYSGRRIGGPLVSGLVIWTGLLPASALAAGRVLLGLGLSALVYGSWALLFLGQRKLRRPCAEDGWTDSVIDRARLHLEVVPIGGLWCLGFVAGVFADPAHGVQWLQMALGGAALTSFGIYASVLANRSRVARSSRWGAVIFWIAALLLVVGPVSPAVRLAVLGVGVPFATWSAERVRLATLATRQRELEAGL